MNHALRLAPVFSLAFAAAAQLPAPTLIPRTTPRAAWSAVTSAGTTSGVTTSPPTVNGTFRADNPGAVGLNKLWVFGGCLGNNTVYTANDLWAFDPTVGTLTQVIADGAAGSPSHRGRCAIAWNPTNNKLTVFGGNTRGGSTGTGTATLLGDTWEYDPITNAWANVTPAGVGPSAREFASMAYDPITGGLLLFGGQTSLVAPVGFSNETWLWLGGTWNQLTPATTPPGRGQHSLATRTDSFNDVVMVGGLDNASAAPEQIRHLDVWRWTGGDWALLSDCNVVANPTGAGATWPASTIGCQAVYDPLRSRLVVQGGNGITVAANTVYVYGPNYAGSPTNYTSEFDSFTNTWSIYANPTTGTTPYSNTDPAIGRISRYAAGFIPSAGKIYKACGQDPTKSGSKPTNNVYAYQATPVAAATTYGTGCAGSVAPLTLTANNLPWTGRTFACTASGFGPLSLGLGILGVAQSAIPLAALLPQGGLGCDLLNTADAIVTLVPTAGQAQLTLPVAASTALAGATLNFQAAELQFDPSLNWVGLFSSNGIAITVGAL